MHGLSSCKNIDGIRYVFLKNIPYKKVIGRLTNQLLFPFMAFFWAMKQCKNIKPDIVIASSPPPFCILAAKYMARKSNAALIYEVRDLWPLVVQELGGVSVAHPYIKVLKRIERYAIENADLVVSVKPGDFDYFNAEYQLPKANFDYLPNGFLPKKTLEKYESGNGRIEDSQIVVGYIGAMSSYYGLNELLDAAEQLKNDLEIKFVLVGAGEDFNSLVKAKKERKLENVEFVGKVPKNEVPSYLASFDICYVGLKDVKANQHGISCNKIFEYMHAGKPIVASYRTRFDPVQDGKCGITVTPGSPGSIVEAILDLKNSVQEREKLGQNGRAYFNANHDFNVIGEKYFERLREIRCYG
jgi:glycosyltransferase involved in cell wall biosynthesis